MEEPERHIDLFYPIVDENGNGPAVALYFSGKNELPSFNIVTSPRPQESEPDKRYGRQHTYYYNDGAIRRSDSLCLISQLCWMVDNGLLDADIYEIEDPAGVLLRYPEALSYHWHALEATSGANSQLPADQPS